ncbi:hypothetical protein LPJ61_000424 [Coemansia biformis]|uniref:Major facilitator superfamily (MFS) profile domain-containing protein n=1 Tax=Coemansia biformis TaxID=1286918 RepID=A0A9W7YGR7_9FUNG|nr:hypothetical protein LPJ61_000424 [Coemansia biformis]
MERSTSGDTPLPWGQLSVLLAVRLAEPVNFSLIQPFVFQVCPMVGGFDMVKSPRDVSFYSGVLFTSFSICQAITTMYWGSLSDRIGRRPTLLIALTGNLVTFVFFGLSRSFMWALVTRSLNGFFAGTAGVVKAATAELSDDSNRSRMMALLPLAWHVGIMAGAAVGGLLVDPAKQYPGLFGHVELFRQYPYLLPCMAGSLTTAAGLVVGLFKLKETLVFDRTASTPGMGATEDGPATESTALVAGPREPAHAPKPKISFALLTPVAKRVMLTNTLMCLVVVMSMQVYPVFAATPPSDGGLGFPPREIGFSLAITGVAVIYTQLIAYPQFERKFGALWCYQTGMKVMVPYFIATPFLSLLAAHIVRSMESRSGLALSMPGSWSLPVDLDYCLLWVLLTALLLIRIVGDILAFTSGNLLVANIAPSKSTLGTMISMQQLAATLTAIVGPLAAGMLWAWSIKHDLPYPFNSHLVWVLSAGILVLAWKLSLQLPASVNRFASGHSD